MAQITHEEGEDAARGALLPHWRTLLLDYLFTAQNGWNISRVKLINPPLTSFMKIDLLSVFIQMDCYDRTLYCTIRRLAYKEQRAQVQQRWRSGTCRWDEEGIKVLSQNKKTQNTDSGIADILVTFGASMAFHKTYEQVVQFTSPLAWDRATHPLKYSRSTQLCSLTCLKWLYCL